MTMSVNQKSIAALLLLLKVTKFFESLPFHEMKRNCAQKVPKEKLQKRVKNGSKISRTSPFEKKSFQITSVTRWLYLLFNFWLFTTMDIVITLPIFRPKSRKIGNVMTKFSTMLNKPSNNWPKWRNFTKSVHTVSNRHWWVSIVNYSAVRFVFHLLVGTHCTLFLCSVRWKYGW